MGNLLEQSSRLALSALLHDLGKLSERARIKTESIESDKTDYCPFKDNKYHTHIHAAYTGAAWTLLEQTGHFPKTTENCAPFSLPEQKTRKFPDSPTNAAAGHHKPDSFLQWVIATADRVASGFERGKFDDYNNSQEDNHYRSRLLSPFENIKDNDKKIEDYKYAFNLQPLSPLALFPQEKNKITPKDDNQAQEEYKYLWDVFIGKEGIGLIPKSHINNLPLWLDHFDSLWLYITHAIPSATAKHSGTKPEVSLYDHCKATAALAVALWRWHNEQNLETVESINDWQPNKLLLVQGEFFGIQNFIFASGGGTQKHAHKLLRGRSFQVSLLAECAALKVLEALDLPSTSQIINAAGKFLIVAPNTESVISKLAQVRKELNQWCLENTYGEIGIGIAQIEASCNDFANNSDKNENNFKALQTRLAKQLDIAKHQRFDLSDNNTNPIFSDFLEQFDNNLNPPVCEINGKYPADKKASERRKYSLSQIADDQITIGENLTKKARVLITRSVDTLPVLAKDYFGYFISFVPDADISGKYGKLAESYDLVRVWDFEPANCEGNIWNGYARRFVNTYVPMFTSSDKAIGDKYGNLENEIDFDNKYPIKTLSHIACENRSLSSEQEWMSQKSLVTLKGDIDNLGDIFQNIEKLSFAKLAGISRQFNMFFALWLPWFCEFGVNENGVNKFKDTYTVFAGGDDFLLIGPWESTIYLAQVMHEKFREYVTHNPNITFSSGLAMTHAQVPIKYLAHSTEVALDNAKKYNPEKIVDEDNNELPIKNAVSLWGFTIGWESWKELLIYRLPELEKLIEEAGINQADFSTGLTYSLLRFSDLANSPKPEDSIWRARLYYKLARFFRDRIKVSDDAREKRDYLVKKAIAIIGKDLEMYKNAYRLPVSILLYRERK